MATITLTLPVSGTVITAGLHANNYTSIQSAINGGLDQNNFAAGKIFDNTKIMQGGAVTGQSLVWNGTSWVPGSNAPYRKTTAKTVNTSVAETDLLNGEITIGAGVLGTSGLLRLTAWGDFLNNAGAANRPQLKLKLGGTTLIDIGAGASTTASATRFGWRVVAEIMNEGAANAQLANMVWRIGGMQSGTGNGVNGVATGEGAESYVYFAGTGILFVGEAFNTATKDTSVAQALALTVTNASASASYETKLFGAVVEVL